MPNAFSVIGKSLPRNDALEKVTGQAKFTADIQLPWMLYAKFLRSPYAHAKITNIDTSRAEVLPGVKCVLTHKNTPKIQPAGRFEYLLDETVHQAGEEVVAVAAETEEIATEAIKLIDVEYEVLPFVVDAEEAIKPGAPLVHLDCTTSNIYHGTETSAIYPAGVRVPRARADGWLPFEVGDVDKGFAEADYIVENVYESPIQANCSPIPRSVICQWTGNNLTCWACCQGPVLVKKSLSQHLRIPQSNIRAITTYGIGGYGSKNPGKIATLVAIMAKKTGRPVKAVYAREEEFVATHHRPIYIGYEKIGVQRDGTITAMQHRVIGNFGRDITYAPEIMASSAAATCGTLYMYQNMKFEGAVVLTNLSDAGPMCGLGDPEMNFILERAMDEAAEGIGMDPLEFRLKNCARYGSRSVSRRDVLGLSHNEREARPNWVNWGIVGHDFDSLQECIRRVREKSGWNRKWKGWKIPVETKGAKKRGIGIAIGMHMSTFRLYSAIIKMNQDGSADVMSSAVEIGQGIKTAMAQVVAETLGINYEDVNVLLADTAATPEGFGVIGSCGTSSAIPAAWHAAKEVRQKLFNIAAPILGVTPDELEAKYRMIYVKYKPEKSISVSQACSLGYQITGSSVNPSPDSIIDEKTGKIINAYACVATVAEVEVDTETGNVNVLKLTSAHDCGRAINPQIVENQICLGLSLSSGYGRTEEYIIDKDTGVVLNPDLLDYKIMTILDMPKADDMQQIFVEYPAAWGAYGSKGFSETGATTGAPAISNAVYNAIGVRIRGDHIKPAVILEALGK